MTDPAVKKLVVDAEEAIAGYAPERCWFFHRFTSWKDVKHGQIVRAGTTQVIGYFIRQDRRCLRCNIVQMREEITQKGA